MFQSDSRLGTKAVMETVFTFLAKQDASNEVKELIYQVSGNNKYYVTPSTLSLPCRDLLIVGLRNGWHGFISSSLIAMLHQDILVAKRIARNLILVLVRKLHRLWF